jgi:hypothetical protein
MLGGVDQMMMWIVLGRSPKKSISGGRAVTVHRILWTSLHANPDRLQIVQKLKARDK